MFKWVYQHEQSLLLCLGVYENLYHFRPNGSLRPPSQSAKLSKENKLQCQKYLSICNRCPYM